MGAVSNARGTTHRGRSACAPRSSAASDAVVAVELAARWWAGVAHVAAGCARPVAAPGCSPARASGACSRTRCRCGPPWGPTGRLRVPAPGGNEVTALAVEVGQRVKAGTRRLWAWRRWRPGPSANATGARRRCAAKSWNERAAVHRDRRVQPGRGSFTASQAARCACNARRHAEVGGASARRRWVQGEAQAAPHLGQRARTIAPVAHAPGRHGSSSTSALKLVPSAARRRATVRRSTPGAAPPPPRGNGRAAAASPAAAARAAKRSRRAVPGPAGAAPCVPSPGRRRGWARPGRCAEQAMPSKSCPNASRGPNSGGAAPPERRWRPRGNTHRRGCHCVPRNSAASTRNSTPSASSVAWCSGWPCALVSTIWISTSGPAGSTRTANASLCRCTWRTRFERCAAWARRAPAAPAAPAGSTQPARLHHAQRERRLGPRWAASSSWPTRAAGTRRSGSSRQRAGRPHLAQQRQCVQAAVGGHLGEMGQGRART